MFFVFAEDIRNFDTDTTVLHTMGLDIEGKRVFVERSPDELLGWCVMCADFGNQNREVVFASGFNDEQRIAVTTAGADPIIFKAGAAICGDVIHKIQDAVLGGKSGVFYDHIAAQTAVSAWATANKVDESKLPTFWWEEAS